MICSRGSLVLPRSIGSKYLVTIFMARLHSTRRVKGSLKTGFACTRVYLWDPQLMAVMYSEVTLWGGWWNKRKKEKLMGSPEKHSAPSSLSSEAGEMIFPSTIYCPLRLASADWNNKQ